MKTIIVIGSSGYIGKEISYSLNQSNCFTIGTTFSNTDTISKQTIALDISSNESIDHFQSKIGNQKIDAIIVSHAYLEKSIFLENDNSSEQLNYDIISSYIDIKSVKILKLVHGLINNLKKSDNPNIVFIGSLIGKKALKSPYAFALGMSCTNGLVESLSKQFGKFNIKVNSVDPGMLQGGVSQYICKENKKDYLQHCALRRFGTAAEVSKVCVWLACKNTFITGKPFVLDGAL